MAVLKRLGLAIGLLVGLSAGASAQSVSIIGAKTPNASAPTANRNLPVMPAIACAAAQSYTSGRVVFPCTNLFGWTGIFLTNPSTGAALSPAIDVVEDDAETNGETGPKVMSSRRDTPAPSCSATGKNCTFNTDANGLLWTRTYDPCSALPTVTDPISVTTDTVIITALSAKKNYICNITIVASAAEIVSITEGTGSVCGTNEAALTGSTTDANGMSFAANGGWTEGNGAATVIKGKTTNVDTCLNVSGANRVSGHVTYVQAP